MAEPSRVLIVDDEAGVRFSLRRVLASPELLIEEAASGEEALLRLEAGSFDLVLADIRMGEVSGLDLLAQVNKRWPGTPVILLTGYASIASAVQALRQGAQDYLIKPVSIHEVRAATWEALSRPRATRAGGAEAGGEVRPGAGKGSVPGLLVDRERRVVVVNETPVQLTPTEFRLLLYLLDNSRVVPYQELLTQLYGLAGSAQEAKTLLMPHVSNLRFKLRSVQGAAVSVQNVRGVGYVLVAERQA